VYAKVEARNPGFSVKDRIGHAMIQDAIKTGALKPGMTIIEPTSGNTGIALAAVGAAKGYKVMLVMPESFSVERRKVLKALGASVLLTERAKGMPGAIERAREIAAADTGGYWMPMQFENPANPAVHEATTGPEILAALGPNGVGVFVAGVGTGGTLTGVSRFLKSPGRCPGLVAVAVEPAESPVLSQTKAGLPLAPSPHPIQGIGAGFVPKALDMGLVDRVETVTAPESMAMARRLAAEEGILSGVSSGAAVAVAARLALLPQFDGMNIVVILPDSGERYLSGALFEGVFPNVSEAKAGDVL
jgi:cysteine synthase A